MDDAAFQRWSERLTELRKKRQTFIDGEIQQKADSFSPKEFYDAAMGSLENIMDAWFEFEEESWREQPPADPAAVVEATTGEMESILDFEVEALVRDKASIVSRITWDHRATEEGHDAFLKLVEDLRKRYQLKVGGLSGGGKKKPAEKAPVLEITSISGRSSGGSGVALFAMFLVGLLFGGAPSIYFLDSAKKMERKFQEDRSRLLADQRALADSMTVLHDSFEQLARGKGRNIPELEKEISRIKAYYLEQRQKAQTEYQRDRDRAFKRIPAGDRQDKVIGDLDVSREERLALLKAKETAALEKLVQQRDLLKDLLK